MGIFDDFVTYIGSFEKRYSIFIEFEILFLFKKLNLFLWEGVMFTQECF